MKLAEGSKPDVEIPAPPAKRCKVCGELMGTIVPHYAKRGDKKPCPESWR